MGLVSVGSNTIIKSEEILNSWKTVIQIHETKLRDAQKTALLKCIEYEIDKDAIEPVIINMPTGTGKTGVIASLIFKSIFKKTLIIVPSDALRTQLSNDLVDMEKYISWQVVPENSKKPKVAKLEPGDLKKIKIEEVDNYFVVIATPQILDSLNTDIQEKFLNKFDRLVIDEAHHSEAPTWKKLRKVFKESKKKIFQFTATPYRGDGKKLEGDLIFQYPVSKAFEEKIFEKISFEGIEEYYDEKADEVIAKKALSILKRDKNKGLDHVLMVKTNTIKNARILKKIYEKNIKNFFSQEVEVLLATSHEGISDNDKNKLKNGETHIVVCVDMFGEGYDLPNLKILALHKKCKSLPIFMQLIGRFTRTNSSKSLGVATIIANMVDDDICEQFQDLYAVDVDWNILIGNLNKEKMESEFFSSSLSGSYSNEIIHKLFSSNSFYIKNSATIYKDVNESIIEILEKSAFEKHFNKNSDNIISAVYKEVGLGIVLTRKRVMPNWVGSEDLKFDLFDIYIFYKKENNLFIYGSNRDVVHGLAKEIGFVNYSYPDLFKIFCDLERSAFANLGILSTSKNTRFRMYTGSDVFKELGQQDLNNNSLSNLFGHGFIKGKKASLGCSGKGVTWSMASANIFEWIKWCESIHDKLINPEIPNDLFVKNMLEPFNVIDLNQYNIIVVSPVDLLTKTVSLSSLKAKLAQKILSFDFYEVKLIKQSNQEILIVIDIYFSDEKYCRLNYQYNLKDKFSLTSKSMNGLELIFRNNDESNYLDLLPSKLELVAWTSNFEVISLNEQNGYKAKYTYTLNKDKVTELDWSGVNINKESWKYGDVENSVQGKIIELLKNKDTPNILFYDDGSNELADLIAFWVDEINKEITIRLYHCKYAIGGNSSIGAINELVQQTLSTCDKLADPIKALKHLKVRENNTFRNTRKSRFVIGNMADLDALIKKYRSYEVTTDIILVQPSLNYAELNSRVNSVLGQLACIIKQTLHSDLYYIIK